MRNLLPFIVAALLMTTAVAASETAERTTHGTLHICKVIASDGEVTDGSDLPSGTFSIPLNGTNDFTSTAAFTTPLSLDTDLFGNDAYDAQCTKYDVPLGDYYYGEEQLPEEWDTPLYNDQFKTDVMSLEDFFNYSGELFDDEANDDERNKDADGHIILNKGRPNRTLVVLNQYTPVCGDGIVNEGETCDDGNTRSGDGCSAECELEQDLTCDQIEEKEGWYGEYFNYNKSHPDMELPRSQWDDVTGHPKNSFGHDWYDEQYFRFARIDNSLQFGSSWYPFDMAPEEITKGHEYHFGAHWSGEVHVPTPGQYQLSIESDDDAWVYVNGELVLNNSGVHPRKTVSASTYLKTGDVIDVYFAERHTVQSVLNFQADEKVSITPYREDCAGYNYTCDDGIAHLQASPSDTGSRLMLVNETTSDTVQRVDYPNAGHSVLAADSDGTLYGIRNSGSTALVTLNPDGTVTEMGDTGLNRAVAMNFGTQGHIYALDQNTNKLYKIDPSDASTTQLTTDGTFDVEGGDLVVNEHDQLIYIRSGGDIFKVDLTQANRPVTTVTNDLNTDKTTSTAYYKGTHYALDRTGDRLFSSNSLENWTLVDDKGQFDWGDATTCAVERAQRVCEGEERLLREGPYPASNVTDSDQGQRKDGSSVTADRSNETKALTFDDNRNSFYSLGFDGSITVAFDRPVQNRLGDDLRIYEDTYGTDYPAETVTVEVSNDGTTWRTLGTADNSDQANDHTATDFDLGTLAEVKYVRLTDTTDPAEFDGFGTRGPKADGFDVNGVIALQDNKVCIGPEACDPEEELVSNGDFEEPVVETGAAWNIFATGTNWSTSWRENNTETPQLELQAGVNGWTPASGAQYAELDTDFDGPSGSTNGEAASTTIQQSIDTVPGETYKVTYAFSPRPGTGVTENVLTRDWDGASTATHSADGTGRSDTNWTYHTEYVTADDLTSTISFTDDGTANSRGTFLDNVSVRCMPEGKPETCDECEHKDGDYNGSDPLNESNGFTITSGDGNGGAGGSDKDSVTQNFLSAANGGDDRIALSADRDGNQRETLGGGDGNRCTKNATSQIVEVEIQTRDGTVTAKEVAKTFCGLDI